MFNTKDVDVKTKEVQTSLNYFKDSKTSDSEDLESQINNLKAKIRQLTEELEQTREDNSLLQRKVKSYLTLSDILKEYKDELQALQTRHNQLLKELQDKPTMKTETEPHKSESPTPGNDLGPNNGHDLAQWTQRGELKGTNTQNMRKPIESTEYTGAISEDILRQSDRKVTTQDLFDVVNTEPSKSSGGSKLIHGSFQSNDFNNVRLPFRDSVGMQESMPPEDSQPDSSSSITGLGFHNVSSNDLSGARLSSRQDLMTFSHEMPPKMTQSQISNEDEDIERITQSLRQLDEGSPDSVNVMMLMSNVQKQMERLKQYKRQLKDDNHRLLERVRTLEREKYELQSSGSGARGQSESPSPSQGGWVHVQQQPQVESEMKQHTSNPDDFAALKQTNQQLLEANQRWSNEWNKLQTHFDSKIKGLEQERDRLEREKVDLQLAEDTKIRDYEKMLMTAKKNREEEENAKEEVLLQLQSVNNRVECFQAQVTELTDTITSLRRQNQALDTELRQRPIVTATSASVQPPGSHDYETELTVLRQQVLVFQEDFDRERQDRAKAQALMQEFRTKCESLKKRLRQLEQKNTALQVKSEDSERNLKDENEKLRRDNDTLREMLRHQVPPSPQYGAMPVDYRLEPFPRATQRSETLFGQEVRNPPIVHPHPQQYIVSPQTQGLRAPPVQHSQYTQARDPVLQMPVTRDEPKMEHMQGAWSCKQCTYINYPRRTVCEICGYIQSPQPNGAFNFSGSEKVRILSSCLKNKSGLRDKS
ncbi:TNIP1-like protein [Mya arenaria]|uniref:TNIP1-like protein n=1 Tax=Mya arenaria TaxID=6604 RepID=A0ABY7DIH7_MYAAR|nr:TNIP1-like protein [Mya arenaria]